MNIMNQLTTVMLVIGCAIGLIIGYLIARMQYAQSINNLLKIIHQWEQHSIEHEAELRQLASDMGYRPEVIGEHITEPWQELGYESEAEYEEDIQAVNKWNEQQDKTDEGYARESWVMKNTNPWTPPAGLNLGPDDSDESAESLIDDKRTPGNHQP